MAFLGQGEGKIQFLTVYHFFFSLKIIWHQGMNQEFNLSSLVFGEILSYKCPPLETRILGEKSISQKTDMNYVLNKMYIFGKEIIVKNIEFQACLKKLSFT